MGNEKYVNYYIETLTTSLSDVVIRNISMQAVAKINDEAIAELSKKNEELSATNAELQTAINTLRDSTQLNENQTIQALRQDLFDKDEVIRNLSGMKNEYENYKSQANHVETFRVELAKARQEIDTIRTNYENQISELNKTIEYLQLTPAKRKKVDSLNKVVSDTSETQEEVIKDGGSF